MRRLTLLFAFALSMTAPVAVSAQEAGKVTTFGLDNGMDVVVIEDHRAPVVVHMVWYRAGSADERPGSSGVAHFLEHLLFKGTDTLEPGEFSATVALNGGTDNAFTSYDTTAYHQRVAADRLGLMMKMEADRMVNLRLSEADILTEREVIIEERNMRVENSPGALFREQKDAALYLNHPYGTPVIGWRHEMEQLDLDDALAYYRQFYAPNNAILVVAGDVTPEEVRTLAEEHYGPLPANPDLGERARPTEPRHLSERRMTYTDPRVSQPYITRSYLAPARTSGAQQEAAALAILSEVLAGGQTSVLTQKLQFESRVAVYTDAYYDDTTLDASSFTLVVVPAAGVSLQEAETALDDVLAEVIAEGIDPDQLDRIKFQIKAAQIYALDNPASIARRYGNALTTGLTVEDVQDWPDVLQAVTGEDIVAAAQKVFDRRHSVTGYLMAPDAQTPQQEVTQ
ncbi:M16 family metallopeptidase [Mameliella alba]|uniref:M16 family metallopeptidase n=1 Tax=Mameliella alba TaxID=561184 RepID=UPI000886A933|nr:pitrilysin family protein [Mameliella alba]MBY6118835.1 insulinase family protein [Mameliella alba]OWV43767.1 insulinase family protein [Mameliella alba]OWV49055.1 insulinase family protein [Mameliella alba]OWV67437.1 insulinase family protein [Mameliella alba]PTR40963.1 zinc protease [Mameliella alba]